MYELNKSGAEAARKSDTGGGAIKELGKYVGEFTQAKDIKTKKGGKGIEFIFKTASGQKANLAIYTMSAEGEKYQGYDALMAIMACMKLRNIAPKLGPATRYDFDSHSDVKEECSIFPDLCKPIGVLLETEDYQKHDGSTGTRMVLKNVFQAATELTASEILDQKTVPYQLTKMVQGLRHRPLKGAKPLPTHQHDMGDDRPFSNADEDDSIPF
jgi:hypothetical protein